ncbi:hypothetical protein ABZ436_08435 [Micromonospora matsumotoense]|uniref:hypothetical protein n=1 Tax=Micromonospora matsumotoense TaxID=121616 RepID=UPI0033F1D44D
MPTDDRRVLRGYAVGFGQWFFFPALEPAIAFGRAAHMSIDCTGYGVYEAAWKVIFCPRPRTPSAGLTLRRWWPDRVGWQEWGITRPGCAG